MPEEKEEGIKRVTLRMDLPLYEEIVAESTEDNRSIHAEVLTLLREALNVRKTGKPYPKTHAGAGESVPAWESTGANGVTALAPVSSV